MMPPDFSRLGLVTEGTWRSYAVFSADEKYRYVLCRNWLNVTADEEKEIVKGSTWAPHASCMTFVMLNPSTASAFKDDPTIRKCIGFAKRHMCQRIIVANLFALRATDPRELTKAGAPRGEHNAEMLGAALGVFGRRVAAWGRFPSVGVRKRALDPMWQVKMYKTLECFGRTKDGEPRHPLMLAYETPIAFYAKVA